MQRAHLPRIEGRTDFGLFQQIRQFRVFPNDGRQPDDVVGIDRFQGFLQVRQGLEGIPKPRQVSWAGRTKGDPCEHALNVANSFQQIVQTQVDAQLATSLAGGAVAAVLLGGGGAVAGLLRPHDFSTIA